MEIKSVKPINFIYFRTETKISELAQFLPVAQELYQEAVGQSLPVTGPIHWHYFGFTGDESKPFQLEIALPVSDVPANYDGKFHFKRTEPYKCVALFHDGSWYEMPKSYAKAMAFIQQNHLAPNGSGREIYINTDFKNPEANYTEIQIGIQ